MNPLFSVLIANYNNDKYLEEAILSVINQTYTNWEIILVDDFSTDNSMNIYKKYESDSRIRILYNDKNYGRGYSKNKCFQNSNGELCGVLDSDDMLVDNALSIMVDLHRQKPQCSLIYSTHYNYTDSDGIIDISEVNGAFTDGTDFAVSSNKIISHFASFKKIYYLKTSGIDVTLNVADDVDLYLKLEEVGDIFFIDLPLHLYRINNSISANRVICKKEGSYTAAKVLMNAFERRISSNSLLFQTKKKMYYDSQRYWLGVFVQNCKSIWSKEVIKYYWIYMKSQRFSYHCFLFLLKIIKTRKIATV